jgi:hypothetical protein
MAWTKWRLLAVGGKWSDINLDHTGPACYELATGGPRGGNIREHYVGETSNEKKRMSRYGSDGSHLAELIHWHLKKGWHIYYHAIACPTKKAAKKMQDNLLKKYEYDWNDMLNR